MSATFLSGFVKTAFYVSIEIRGEFWEDSERVFTDFAQSRQHKVSTGYCLCLQSSTNLHIGKMIPSFKPRVSKSRVSESLRDFINTRLEDFPFSVETLGI